MNERFVLTGVVVRGRGKGRTVGMPTANLAPDAGQALPPCGVYATRVRWRGQTFDGVTNVGTRPSVDHDNDITIETLLLDFAGTLYGERIAVEFCAFLRPTRAFPSLLAVRAQVLADAKAARSLLDAKKPPAL